MPSIADIYFITETNRLIRRLKKLHWPSLGPYHTTLPKNKELDDNFYKNVKLVNTLALAGQKLYAQFPHGSMDKLFFNYFLSTAFESENFIWKTPGLMQSYYDKGIPWQDGSIVGSPPEKRWQLPALSSAIVDCVIAYMIIRSSNNENEIFWLANEQQNFASGTLLTGSWCYPVKTISNPILFDNVHNPKSPNPHRLVFEWFSLATDIINWLHKSPRQREMLYEIPITFGKELWKLAGKNKITNIALLEQPEIKRINVDLNLSSSMQVPIIKT